MVLDFRAANKFWRDSPNLNNFSRLGAKIFQIGQKFIRAAIFELLLLSGGLGFSGSE